MECVDREKEWPRAVRDCFHISRETSTFLSTCSSVSVSCTRGPTTLSHLSTREFHAFSFKTPTTHPSFSHHTRFSSFFLAAKFPLSNTSMASSDLKHRITPDPDTTNDVKRKSGGGGGKRDKRMVMAKRGLKSLAIAVTIPLSLTSISAYIGSSSAHEYAVASRRPFWFPPSWALHLTCPASSFLMGLSAWMVWADGGFHRNPTALLLYFTQLLFTVLWDPLVFAAGATRLGLMLCVALFLTQFGCMRVFRPVNPIAAYFIKPCLAWVAFLSILNLKLLFV